MVYTRNTCRGCLEALALSALFLALPVQAETVRNTVSVSAHAGPDGQSSVHSITTINGVTVDEVHETGTGFLKHQSSFKTTTSSPSFARPYTQDIDDMRATLQALMLTLQHYVSYLISLQATAATPAQ